MTFPVVGSNIPSAYQISNSLRFNQGDTPHLDKTFGSAGTSNKTGTLSFWYKRTTVGNVEFLFHVYPNRSGHSNDRTFIAIGSDNKLVYERIFEGSSQSQVRTTQLFRDVSAWYHFIIIFDTTQSTASDRLKIYLNGNQITDFSTTNYPAQNLDIDLADAHLHTVGAGYSEGSYVHPLDGYLAEYHYIDGTAKSPTDFGEFDSDSGVWKPKQYAGTYGTNGFYLKFNNAGNMGEDSSGNDNTFTPTNLSGTTDVTTDTPTNNFCTLNSLFTGNGAQLAEANTKVTLQNGTAGWTSCASTIALPSVGKYYAEFKVVNYVNGYMGLGFYLDGQTQLQGNTSSTAANNANWWSQYGHDSNFYNNGVAYSGGQTWSSGILMLAHDADTGKVWWGHNGTWFNSGNPATGTNAPFTITRNGRNLYMIVEGYNGVVWEANFGNPPFSISSGNSDDNGYGNFEYAPPSGYLALCTQNLATELSPTIDDGSEYFNTVLYTGNSSVRSITGVGFQPDWTWIKSRSNASWHALQDSSRGSLKTLFSNTNDSETTYTDSVTSFDSDGFSMGDDSEGGSINVSSRTYVAWNWKANAGSTSSNTDGSITSTVQANTTAGFSIVTYTGTGSNATIGHGLGVAPKMIICKQRNNTLAHDWIVYHESIGNTDVLQLNQDYAKGTYSVVWNNTSPTSSVFSVGTAGSVNESGKNQLAYCFAEIEGYSKFGAWVGNGSTTDANRPFIYTGFRPAFVLWKDTNSATDWRIIDNKRNSYNVANSRLFPNSSSAENSAYSAVMDFLSNGFKIRGTHTTGINTSGNSYIYMAFAENPFVTSGAVPVTAR